MALFTSTDAKDFSSKLSQFDKLMKAEGISREEAIQKKSYVAICSLPSDKTNFSY